MKLLNLLVPTSKSNTEQAEMDEKEVKKPHRRNIKKKNVKIGEMNGVSVKMKTSQKQTKVMDPQSMGDNVKQKTIIIKIKPPPEQNKARNSQSLDDKLEKVKKKKINDKTKKRIGNKNENVTEKKLHDAKKSQKKVGKSNKTNNGQIRKTTQEPLSLVTTGLNRQLYLGHFTKTPKMILRMIP